MFIPKSHKVQMSELSVPEMGELFEVYERAVQVFRNLGTDLPPEDFNGKFIFFWRFRDRLDGETTDQVKLSHFHLHLAPDRERMFDPILNERAVDYDYKALVELANRKMT